MKIQAKKKAWSRAAPWLTVGSAVLCVAAMLCLAPGTARAEEAMRFEALNAPFCPPQGCIAAKGRIVGDTHQAFSQTLRRLKVQPGAELILESSGGDVVGALKLGLQIRKAGLATHVIPSSDAPGAGVCASACAYAFLGGVGRRVHPGARLGVHQFADNPAEGVVLSAAQSQRLVAVISDYMESVGANLRLETVALRTPPAQIHWLTPSELTGLSVVTTVSEAM